MLLPPTKTLPLIRPSQTSKTSAPQPVHPSLKAGLVTGSCLTGILPMFGPVASRPTCGIVARGPGQWAWISQALGFEVSWIWSPDTTGLPDWLRSTFPHAFYTTVVSALRQVDLILCDSKPPTWLRSWDLAPVVVSTASSLALQARSDRRIRVRHSAMGGLTERGGDDLIVFAS
jgi:hypothetical protein